MTCETFQHSSQFEQAYARFDEENSRDPNTEKENGAAYPRELLYAKRLTDWVLKLDPQASEALRLAARCQHICRWMIPRDSYEMNRAGYLQWRNALKQLHAAKAGDILRESGYPDTLIQSVQDLNLKKNFPKDPESRSLEDALCLVFLQYQFTDFMKGKEESKLIEVLQKTWKKMSDAGRKQALLLPVEPKAKALIEKALS